MSELQPLSDGEVEEVSTSTREVVVKTITRKLLVYIEREYTVDSEHDDPVVGQRTRRSPFVEDIVWWAKRLDAGSYAELMRMLIESAPPDVLTAVVSHMMPDDETMVRFGRRGGDHG